MYKDIIEYILSVAARHKAVKTTKYQSRLLINAQPSNPSLQFVIEDNADAQYYKTAGVFALNLNIDVTGFPDSTHSSLDIQSYCFQTASEIVAFVDNDPQYKSILSTLDKDYLFLSHFTDDNSSGVRLSWQLAIPDPVNLCILSDNFNDEAPLPEEGELELDPSPGYKENEGPELTLKPIRLPKNKK